MTTLEQQILSAIISLKENAYGLSIQAALRDALRTEPSLGSVYASLDRLEERGFVKCKEGEASARGGRRKLLFWITAPGQRALHESFKATGAAAQLAGMKGALA